MHILITRFFRVEPGVSQMDEPKFIVFYTMLITLFTKFCFNCKSYLPSVSMKAYGTMVMVEQQCKTCGKGFKWQSQPLVLGKYPLGNILLSLSVLMSGGSISKVLLIFKHMGLAVYSARTFFRHQTKFLFPVILKHWADSRKALIRQLKNISNASWCGDGRFDSMGHNAKFGSTACSLQICPR